VGILGGAERDLLAKEAAMKYTDVIESIRSHLLHILPAGVGVASIQIDRVAPASVHVEIEIDDTEEEPYDDSKDHTRCPDCKGSGKYVGLREVEDCPRCDGSGWI